MIRPNYRDYRLARKKSLLQGLVLSHSAKGSEWKEHKYIKRIDGTYYYPDDYVGGRHLPDSERGTSNEDLEDWEKVMYSDIENQLKRNPGLFNPKDLASGDLQDFRLTLAEFAGVDADELSEAEIKRMQNKMKQHYSTSSKSSSKDSDSDEGDENYNITSADIEKLAMEVIRGDYGNGQERKDLLGEYYSEIQSRVNEIMKGSTGSTKVSESSSNSKETQEAVNNASKVHSGIDIDEVMRVYNKIEGPTKEEEKTKKKSTKR